MYDLRGEIFSHAEATLGELNPDSSLSSKLDNFWDAWQDLASNPANDGMKANVREMGADLARASTSRANSLLEVYEDQNFKLGTLADEVNEKSDEIARLNMEIIHHIAIDEQPNALLDKRDSLLDRLAEVAGAKSYFTETGDSIVTVAGHVLIHGSTANKITFNDPTNEIIWENGRTIFDPVSGEITGVLQARASIKDQRDKLDTLAVSIIDWVNDVHKTRYWASRPMPPNADGLAEVPPGGAGLGRITLGGNGAGNNDVPIADFNGNDVLTAAGRVLGYTERELGEGIYTIETRDNAGVAQFRIKDADGNVVEIDADGAAGGAMTQNWIDIPVGANFDTNRGLEITFEAAATLVVGNTATLKYESEGLDIPIADNDTLRDIAAAINATLDLQPEGRVISAFVIDNQLFLTPEEPGVNHEIIAVDDTDALLGLNLTLSGTPPVDFFAGENANTIRLSDEIKADLSLIHASKAPGFTPGDGSIAQLLADGRDATNFNIGGELTNANDSYNLQVTEFSLEVNYVMGSKKDRLIVANAISEQRLAFTGVLLDEEAANLLKYQKSFQAATKVITIANALIDTLMGIVKS